MPEILDWLSKVNLLRHRQRQEMREDRTNLEKQMKEPGIKNPGEIVKEMRRLDKQLTTQSPRDVSAMEKDLLAKKEVELREQIVSGMPTHEEMRRNPPGAVHKHMQFERAKKPLINLWKNIKIQLDPDSSDPDLANIERLRPHQAETGTSTFMVNAQIPGTFAMTPQAKSNWPVEMPEQGTANSVLAQAQKRERTPEQRAEFGQRMKEARARKHHAAAKET